MDPILAESLHEGIPFDESKHKRGSKGSSEGGRFITKGATGQDVKRVQRGVGARTDGRFGDRTQRAVRRFQRRNKLQVDGVVGRQTAAALGGRKDASKVRVGSLSQKDLQRLRKGS